MCLDGCQDKNIDSVLACCVSSLVQTQNIQSNTICVNTLSNYLSAVHIYLEGAKLPFPPNHIVGGGKAKHIIDEVKLWETVPTLRNPISEEICTYLLRLHTGLDTQHNIDSLG